MRKFRNYQDRLMNMNKDLVSEMLSLAKLVAEQRESIKRLKDENEYLRNQNMRMIDVLAESKTKSPGK